MLEKESDISAEVGSRICHDLSSPIGAISNGIELLELSGATQSPEVVLIADSVRAANAKLRFLRIAFGNSSSDATVNNEEIKTILGNNYDSQRLCIDWNIDQGMTRHKLKLCFLILMCIEGILPCGGTISVIQNKEGFSFSVVGQNIQTDGVINFAAQQFYHHDGPAKIHYVILRQILTETDCHLEILKEEQNIIIRLIA